MLTALDLSQRPSDNRQQHDMQLVEYGQAAGFLMGVLVTVRAFEGACPSQRVTTDQVTQVWVNYAKARPEKWDEGVSPLAVSAFANAWPCSTPGPKPKKP